MWGDISWESYHNMKGEPIDSKTHYNEIMIGDQLLGHADLKNLNNFGLFSILFRKIKKNLKKGI